jgi:hypothetical protein
MTTSRVSVNHVTFDMMLTTQRLILIDSGYARFEPQMIPLLDILSLAAGKVATGEPVITLALTGTESIGEPETMNLIFFQQPGEQRKRERDEWLRKLMGNIVSARQPTVRTDILPVQQEREIRPPGATPHPIDMVFPHQTIVEAQHETEEIVILPDEPEFPMIPGEETVSPAIPISRPLVVEEPPVEPEKPTETPDTVPTEIPGTEILAVVPKEEKKSPDTTTTAAPASQELQSGAGGGKEPVDPFTVAALRVQQSTASREEQPETPGTVILKTPSVAEPVAVFEGEHGFARALTRALRAAQSFLTAPKVKEETPDTGTRALGVVGESKAVPEEQIKSLATANPEAPAIVESPEVLTEQPEIPGAIIPPAMVIGEAEKQPAAEATPEEPESPVPPPAPRPGHNRVFAVIAVVIIILGLAGGAFLYSHSISGKNEGSRAPTLIPTPTILQTPTPPTAIIPKDGIWVRVLYPGNYLGWVGNPGSLEYVGGSGDQFYRIPKPDSLVQASFQKQENSGEPLAIEVYRDGEMIYRRTVRAPKGEIAFIIDPKTGKIPYITPAVTR